MNDRGTPTYRDMFGGSPTPLDPVNSANIIFAQHSPDHPAMQTKIGRVVDCWPSKRCCLVQSSFSVHTRCFFSTESLGQTNGVTRVSAPQIGQFVAFFCPREGDFGVVVKAFNWQNTSILPSFKIPIIGEYHDDFDQVRDAESFFMESLQLEGDNGAHLGDLVPGEEYALNEHNVGYILSKLFMRLQAGSLCSTTYHWTDRLLEIVAHNLRLKNSGMILQALSDYGRTTTELGFSPVLKDFINNQELAQTVRMVAGWFGNGLTLYSQNKNGPANPGSSIWMDELGTLAFTSQVGSWLGKVNGIYTPKRIAQPDSIDGEVDREIDEVAARLAFDIAKYAHPAGFGCQARDYVAWATSGKYQFERFRDYEKDWEKPEIPPSTTRGLGSGFYADFPEVIELKSAQEELQEDGNQYRPGDAFCGVLPDGSVLLRDAWGSSIEMRGGRIKITNPKDVEIVSGRNTVIMSGSDTIIRSQDCCDITATESDIRIRGGKNVMVDADEGGILVTALKTTGPMTSKKGEEFLPSGITFRTNGAVEVVAQKFQASLSDRFVVEGQGPDIDPTIWLKARSSMLWSRNGHYFAHGENADEFIGMNNGGLWTSGNITTKQHLSVYGNIGTDGFVTAGKSISCNDFIASLTNGPYVGTLRDRIEELEEFDPGAGLREHFVTPLWNETLRYPYLPEDYERLYFHHRTVEQYGTQDAVWFEAFWQRQFKAGLVVWNSSKDVDQDGEFPYPGKAHLNGTIKSWITYQETNVELDGTPKKAELQSHEGGVFTPRAFTEQPFHQ